MVSQGSWEQPSAALAKIANPSYQVELFTRTNQSTPTPALEFVYFHGRLAYSDVGQVVNLRPIVNRPNRS